MGILTDRAHGVAQLAHFGQSYGSIPYIDHLTKIKDTLHEYNFTSDRAGAIAYLLDTLFVTKLTKPMLTLAFGIDIAEDVASLTGKGATPAEQKLDVYSRLPNLSPMVVIVEMARQLSSLRNAAVSNTSHNIPLYTELYPEFFKAAYGASSPAVGQTEKMWSDLHSIVILFTKFKDRGSLKKRAGLSL